MIFNEVRIQHEDFLLSQEIEGLRKLSTDIGAISNFIGYVRDDGQGVTALELEHYPLMSEKKIRDHVLEAGKRWPLIGVLVVHRVGRIELGEQIVLVLAASEHREASIQATEFIMDFLKSDAPFWKKQITEKGENWVEAKEKDQHAAEKWKE